MYEHPKQRGKTMANLEIQGRVRVSDAGPPRSHLRKRLKILDRYVGNTMAALVMQSLGCDVAALNTVQFSETFLIRRPGLTTTTGNHRGYGAVSGTTLTADEMHALYKGLYRAYLDDFDMLLSGYVPNASSVETLGSIARDLRRKSSSKPGSFFWGMSCSSMHVLC